MTSNDSIRALVRRSSLRGGTVRLNSRQMDALADEVASEGKLVGNRVSLDGRMLVLDDGPEHEAVRPIADIKQQVNSTARLQMRAAQATRRVAQARGLANLTRACHGSSAPETVAAVELADAALHAAMELNEAADRELDVLDRLIKRGV